MFWLEEILDQLENLDHLLSIWIPMVEQEFLELENAAPAPSPMLLQPPLSLADNTAPRVFTPAEQITHLPPTQAAKRPSTSSASSSHNPCKRWTEEAAPSPMLLQPPLSLADYTAPRVFTPAEHITHLPPTQTAKRPSTSSASSSRNPCKRWTEEDHMLFLEGFALYGKGNCKNIAKPVKTRTSTQVASHAQKYFLHLQASNKKGKRKSIYDMTLYDQVPPPHQNWVLPPNLATY